MKREIRLAIYQAGFDSQGDFAMALNIDESLVSRILNGRRKLDREKADRWIELLKCDPELLEGIVIEN